MTLYSDLLPDALPFIHPTAEVSPQAVIGSGTKIWHFAQVREGATIGANCILGSGAYVDTGVHIGNNVKIENNASIFRGTTLEDGVFIGPHACLTNDRFPRAINPDGSLKAEADWELSPITVRRGASIGAGAIILPGITIGSFALVGAGSVVTHDVGEHDLMVGNPARRIGSACLCGTPARDQTRCPTCGWAAS